MVIGGWARRTRGAGTTMASRRGCLRLLSEIVQGVIAAAGELAGDGDGRQPRATSIPAGLVVVVVRRGWPRRALGRLVQCPAQQLRALPGQVPGRAMGVRGMHGDVQTGVTHHGGGVPETTHVTELGRAMHYSYKEADLRSRPGEPG
jgi:hypothetical protein